jgi:hypothetical protein
MSQGLRGAFRCDRFPGLRLHSRPAYHLLLTIVPNMSYTFYRSKLVHYQ